jgi:murein L,D-transpeptidase YafK
MLYTKKGCTYILLAGITLLPWNATAINLAEFALFPTKSIVSHVDDLAENLLAKSLIEVTQGKNQQALNTIDQLLLTTPNFNLANLVRGDLLMAQAHPLRGFGDNNEKASAAVKDLQAEARVRLEHYLSKKNLDSLPNLLLAPNKQQDFVIVVDTDKSRLYLYKNDHDGLSYVADYYITVGRNGIDKHTDGDKRTPIGVYFAGKKLSQPLDDMYGDIAYPLNYPNEWDHLHNRKGSGIWLHGTSSKTFSRPPQSSAGCIVLSTQNLKALEPFLHAGNTPVIIVNHLKWLDSQQVYIGKRALKEALESWVIDFNSQDTDKYLSHYSENFSSNGMHLKQWSAHKPSVQAGKSKIDISLSDISMFTYPDAEKSLVVVDFIQNDSSQNLSNKMQKRQYWILENNSWKIIYEGAV